MSYAWRLWIGFTLVLAVVLAATAFLSITALRLERAEAEARRQAAIEEHVRLALWRMDSALAPLLAQENSHPQYRTGTRSLASADVWRDRSSDASQPRLTRSEDPFVLLRFQYEADPGEPSESDRDLGSEETLVKKARQSGSLLQDLARRIPRQKLLSKLPEVPKDSSELLQVASTEANPRNLGAVPGTSPNSRATVEFQQRNQALISNSMMAQQLSGLEPTEPDSAGAMMTPVWTSGEMLLARRIRRGGVEYVQGSLIDWQTLQQWLLETVNDLLPDARLEPLESFDAAGEPGLLAALPVRLIPGPLPVGTEPPRSVVPRTLALAWIAVLLSSLVGGVLVVGVVRLSQRRAAFVAAVTHELRTPLTTFRMYSEMLAQGMVRDGDAQREYLQTLRDQSLRLSHLVENVLAYARLERGRGLSAPERTSLRQMIDPVLPSLEQRASSDRMELVVEWTEVFEAPIWANPSAVEQILVNLIDNACKYAAGTGDHRICLTAYREARHLVLRVRDHGPGLPASRKRFRPFDKTVQEAAHSAPGIGLGLALSRRLAKQMGGRLDVDRTITDGAALLLRLPIRKAT